MNMGEEVSHLKAHVNTFYNNGALQRASEQPHLKTNQKPSQINKKVGSQELTLRVLRGVVAIRTWSRMVGVVVAVPVCVPRVGLVVVFPIRLTEFYNRNT
ncbi:hypothetical protein [Ruegeria sp.]|uniref:hypothetical protein n=1 Tax=Ruegeria sp. TaxID=1879320 RepID=UPI003B00CF34